jgi:energy-converting hydrogenase A subunit R
VRIFITDCEGPISKNDNALELAAHFVPQGERFFSVLSSYDDYLAFVEKRPGYKAGDTLRLILPFLKAFGATDERIEEFSRVNILLIPGADETLRLVRKRMTAYIISTSYAPYIRALCAVIGFPFEATYCTALALDQYELPREEARFLREAVGEIVHMPLIRWEQDVTGLEGLPASVRKAVEQLNRLFWEEIAQMQINRIIAEVDPIGGAAKAAAVRDIVKKTKSHFSDVMYVGDSITDLAALEMVKQGGGLAVSFNGNAYAIQGAEVACVGRDTGIISRVAELFAASGKPSVMSELSAEGKGTSRLESDGAIGKITSETLPRWIEQSQQFRKEVRGVSIGSLG